MQIILSKDCLALQGLICRGYGYFIVKRGKSFFSQRSKHSVPPDGHLRFIFLCAELVRDKLFIDDIRVSGYEIKAALTEAALLASANRVNADYEYSAAEILDLKTLLAL